MSDISVIIRCRDEEQWVGHSIQSVMDVFDSPEIIIVDNNSTDSSMDIVKMFKKDKLLKGSGNYTNVRIYNIDKYSPGVALNFGVSKCSNNYVLILSAHSQIMECHFGKIQRYLEDYCVVGGKQIPIYRGKKIIPRYIWSNFIDDDTENYFSESEDRYFLHNAFTFYKKETLIKYPFDEVLIGKEDRYWVNNRIKDGMKSYYDSATKCYHHYTENGATWKGLG